VERLKINNKKNTKSVLLYNGARENSWGLTVYVIMRISRNMKELLQAVTIKDMPKIIINYLYVSFLWLVGFIIISFAFIRRKEDREMKLEVT